MKSAVEHRDAVVTTDREGVMRVGGTRVALESVVAGFTEGATAEEIQMRYPVLSLADAYGAIAWYLANQKQADRYVAERSRLSAAARKECVARYDHAALGARLVARAERHRRAQVHA